MLTPTAKQLRKFQQTIWGWYKDNRRSFPWRETRDPYRIFVSEIMLQQTQTHRVLPKYQLFIEKFPTWESLATTSLQEILRTWQGLGYNRRAKFLHQTAHLISNQFQGKLPQTIHELKELPGVGDYTASAVITFAFNQPTIFIETNIRTVFIHHFFSDAEGIHDQDIKQLIEQTVEKDKPREWYSALMDYGAYLKTTVGNLNSKSKHYTKQSKFEGSTRQLRGKILRLLAEKPYTQSRLETILEIKDVDLLKKITQDLTDEGLVSKRNNYLRIT